MNKNCELCGHELGFFERSLSIDNTRLGLNFNTLCSNCHRSVLMAIDAIDNISSKITQALNGQLKKYPNASSDINVLIFLSVLEIFKQQPDYFQKENLINEIFYPVEENIKTRFDYLIQITYKILRSGFLPVLGKYGLETFESFSGYMARACLFISQQRVNVGSDNEIVYSDIFISPSGLVFLTDSGDVKSIYIPRDRTYRFEKSHQKNTYDLKILKHHFVGGSENPTIYFNRKDLREEVIKTFQTYNELKNERIQGELESLIYNLNEKIEKELTLMHPQDDIKDIPLDSVLVCAVKTLFEANLNDDFIKEAPNGLLNLIIETYYPVNFERSGLSEISELEDYLKDECRFIYDFSASFNQNPAKEAFAFLTPRAYMIKILGSNDVFIDQRNNYPNDLYTEYNYMIFQGRREFYIKTATSKSDEEGYFLLSGIHINAPNRGILKEFESYFKKQALDYYQNKLEHFNENIDSLTKQIIDDHVRRIFVGYGYLPFCIYDEWAQVEKNLRESDIFIKTIIPYRKEKTGTGGAKIFYADKTTNNFERQAARLAEELNIEKLPVARAILYEELKKQIIDICAQEFIRLCGDIVKEEDSLEDSFIKYVNLGSISPQKAYYLGLFIYYLISKNKFLEKDFLENYDESVKTFLEVSPEDIKQVEFTELKETSRKGYDSKPVNLNTLKEEKEEAQTDSFVLGVTTNQDDILEEEILVKKIEKAFDSDFEIKR